MKILGIDYGTKNIGLALSDDEANFAFPYKQLIHENLKTTFLKLKKICKEENVEKIIIGLPINLAGEKTESTQKVQDFILELEKEINLPIQTIDERLSTEQAYKIGANKKDADQISAQILLQNWLDKE